MFVFSGPRIEVHNAVLAEKAGQEADPLRRPCVARGTLSPRDTSQPVRGSLNPVLVPTGLGTIGTRAPVRVRSELEDM